MAMGVVESVPDGLYFLFPQGSGWIAASFADGECKDQSEEWQYDSHTMANDGWAGIRPSGWDDDVSVELADSIVRTVMGDDHVPDMVVVSRFRDPEF